MDQNQILVNEEGLKRLVAKIKELEEKLAQVSSGKAEAAETGGNMWHDNFAFEQIEREQRALTKQLSDARDTLRRAVVISDQRQITEKIDIGSVVDLDINGEHMTIRVGDYTEADPANNVVSYRSPLGDAILHASIGETREYGVGNRTFKVVIKGIRSS